MERLGLSVTAPGVASNSEQQSCRLLTLALQSGAAQTCTSAEHDVYNAAQACNTQRADSDACADGDECAMWCQMCYHTVDEFLAKVKGMSKEDAKAFRKQHLTVTAENVTYEDSDEVRSVQSSFKYNQHDYNGWRGAGCVSEWQLLTTTTASAASLNTAPSPKCAPVLLVCMPLACTGTGLTTIIRTLTHAHVTVALPYQPCYCLVQPCAHRQHHHGVSPVNA